MKTQLTPFENYYVICLYFFVVVGIQFGQNIFLLFIIFCSYVWSFCLILIMNTCFNMMLFAATSISLVVHDCVCWFFRCAYILCLFVVFRIFQTELINICSPVNFAWKLSKYPYWCDVAISYFLGAVCHSTQISKRNFQELLLGCKQLLQILLLVLL